MLTMHFSTTIYCACGICMYSRDFLIGWILVYMIDVPSQNHYCDIGREQYKINSPAASDQAEVATCFGL